MADLATWSSFATAGGTLVLAVVTFASVRSGNRSARIAERSMLVGLRPLLLNSRMQDPEQKIGFADQHWVRVAGGRGSAELEGGTIYLTASVRNVGAGLALMHGWAVVRAGYGDAQVATPLPDFRRLTRDLYVAGSDIGFWQGAIREETDPDFDYVAGHVKERETISIDVLYGDQEGKQRTISRFTLIPVSDGETWFMSVGRHFFPDREDPR